jgi:hypothetical protein
MAASKRLKDLRRQVEELRNHFLPMAFNSLGSYPGMQRVHAHTRAFLVFSHAEIESYFEGWAKDIARATEDVWKNSQRITEPLAFLIATLAEKIDVPEKLVGPNRKDAPQLLQDQLIKLFPNYYKQIKDNNGIKEHNVLSLFGPLGIPATAIGSTLLPNLDSLGADRGDHAHNSAKAVKNVLDPQTEYNRVVALVNDLSSIDSWFLKYRRRIR